MRWTTIIVGAVLLAGSAPAWATSDQENARDAFQRGEIMSLEDIRRNVQRDFNGQIIRTRLKSDNADYVYKFRVLSPNGNIVNVDVDARTSRIIGVKGQR
ncbi:PepSY domain-containing protein [Emcibacter sp. SYSU 3D8]|uniref:PepSY domain-containing protein n=1 Tax=Emcibacter sp. SYSU 3D8 TaxID=3133969 RepID=UPI0031FED305